MPDEFDLIKKYFAPLSGEYGLGLLDDASCIPNRSGYDIVVTKDLIVEGTHFRQKDPVATIGYKAVAVNVSDCLAKGATPAAYWLGLALPKNVDEKWFADFSTGLKEANHHFGCSIAGGDTTAHNGSGVIISVTMLGYVPDGTMVKRSGAQAEDDIYVTGHLGDSALGLFCLNNNLMNHPQLTEKYTKPSPPFGFQNILLNIATAAADISDGLLADVEHVCKASSLGCVINHDALPVSGAAQTFLNEFPEKRPLVWSGGDDYQIVFTANKQNRSQIAKLSKQHSFEISRVGRVTKDAGIHLLDSKGENMQLETRGFKHF